MRRLPVAESVSGSVREACPSESGIEMGVIVVVGPACINNFKRVEVALFESCPDYGDRRWVVGLQLFDHLLKACLHTLLTSKTRVLRYTYPQVYRHSSYRPKEDSNPSIEAYLLIS